jgi:hypothetical protein
MPTGLADGLGLRDVLLLLYSEAIKSEDLPHTMGPPFQLQLFNKHSPTLNAELG